MEDYSTTQLSLALGQEAEPRKNTEGECGFLITVLLKDTSSNIGQDIPVLRCSYGSPFPLHPAHITLCRDPAEPCPRNCFQ